MLTIAQLRDLAERLPPGGALTLPREALLEALGAETLQPAADPPAPPGDLTVLELAARFRRRPSTARGWLEAGRFPGAYKLRDRDWRVPVAAVEAFVAQERRPGGRGATAQLGAWRKHRRRT